MSVLILEDDYQEDFNHQNSITKVFRFTNAKCTRGFHESENVNIRYVNGSRKNSIYSFFPKVSPGYKIIESSVHLVYLPITMDIINNLGVSITDQDDNLLDLRDKKLTIRFHFREAR